MSLIFVLAIGAISIACLFVIALTSGSKARVDAAPGTPGNSTGRATPIPGQIPPSAGMARRRSASRTPVDDTGLNQTVPAMAVPRKEEARKQLGERLVQAGLYKRNSKSYFYFLQFIFASIPFVVGFVAYTMGLVSIKQAAFMAAITGISGIVAPGLWLDFRKSARQTKLRRALPDALDVITVCIEAGLSFTAAIVNVSKELVSAHPMLANEMKIVHREIQMGKSTGQALKNLAQRFDVEELRSLASVTEQSERFGASIAAALKVYAESLRVKRMLDAQTRAQKAAVKLLFPTILCIFPALLVVILGPAAFEIYETMQNIGK